MPEPVSPGWLSRLGSVLGADHAERAIDDALTLLGEIGIFPSSASDEAPDLEIEVPGRRLSLTAREPLDPSSALLLKSLLRAILVRAVEQLELRRARERLEMLS